MSHRYQAVKWNQHKRVYDLFVLASIAAYVIVFIGGVIATTPPGETPSTPILLIRATGTLALLMLHVVLAIGPLARISPLFHVLLYNRRHLGVLTATVATVHGLLNLAWYFGFGDPANPVSALFATTRGWGAMSTFPYPILGAGALVILFVMAATSHDYWLAALSPRAWKWLHMSVYVAYALLIGHVALGAAQNGRGEGYGWLLGGGFAAIALLHLIAGLMENNRKELKPDQPWIDAAAAGDLRDGRGHTVRLRDGRSIALFRDGEKVWALSNVCAHQQGPLGEGRVIAGCATCPWHGHQFRVEDGQAPPPYDDRVPVYRVKVKDGRVFVRLEPADAGESVSPGLLSRSEPAPAAPPPSDEGERPVAPTSTAETPPPPPAGA